jgi:Flp pilus assembly protein TadD
VALKNLGAILGQEGDSLRSLYYLRQSFEIDPQDPQTVYGLAFAYMELEAPEDLLGLARNRLREIAAWQLKIGGPIHRDIRKSN